MVEHDASGGQWRGAAERESGEQNEMRTLVEPNTPCGSSSGASHVVPVSCERIAAPAPPPPATQGEHRKAHSTTHDAAMTEPCEEG